MPEPLTNDEISLLMDALDAWEKEPGTMGMSFTLMTAMLMGKSATREQRDEQLASQQAKMLREERVRKDKTIMLRAKIHAMRKPT